MTDFKDTSNWEKKNNSTIIYRYDYQGKSNESELEKEPHLLPVDVERLSVMDRTAWHIANQTQSDKATGFHSDEFIRATGILDMCRVHAFIIGDTDTVTFDRIEVAIYPTSLEDLQTESHHKLWSLLDANKRPEDGWLKDERGTLSFFEPDGYTVEPLLFARLFLDQSTFEALVQKIKHGPTIRTARLEILADLFQFGYEGAFQTPLTVSNLGLLYNNEDSLTSRTTKARLEELSLEWTPTLTRPTVDDEPLEDLPLDTTDEDKLANAVNHVALDVKSIRARVDTFYKMAILVLVVLVLWRILSWLSM